MERTNHWAALYFILLMTFGNYVLFNLLVAILVEGFKCQNDLFAEAYSEMEDFYSGSEIQSDCSSETNLEDKRIEGGWGKQRINIRMRGKTLSVKKKKGLTQLCGNCKMRNSGDRSKVIITPQRCPTLPCTLYLGVDRKLEGRCTR